MSVCGGEGAASQREAVENPQESAGGEEEGRARGAEKEASSFPHPQFFSSPFGVASLCNEIFPPSHLSPTAHLYDGRDPVGVPNPNNLI